MKGKARCQGMGSGRQAEPPCAESDRLAQTMAWPLLAEASLNPEPGLQESSQGFAGTFSTDSAITRRIQDLL